MTRIERTGTPAEPGADAAAAPEEASPAPQEVSHVPAAASGALGDLRTNEMLAGLRIGVAPSQAADQAVDTVVYNMSYGLIDYRIGPENVQKAFDALNSLSGDDRNKAMAELFRKEGAKYGGRLFAELVEDKPHLVPTVLGWFAGKEVSDDLKRALVRDLKGEAFANFLGAMNRLPADQQQAIIDNFGADRWAGKLAMEAVRARVEGITSAGKHLGTAIGLAKNIPGCPPGVKQVLDAYGKLTTAMSEAVGRIVIRALETGEGAGQGEVWKQLAAMGVEDPMATLLQIGEALNR